jgi:hypothetical protein
MRLAAANKKCPEPQAGSITFMLNNACSWAEMTSRSQTLSYQERGVRNAPA